MKPLLAADMMFSSPSVPTTSTPPISGLCFIMQAGRLKYEHSRRLLCMMPGPIHTGLMPFFWIRFLYVPKVY